MCAKASPIWHGATHRAERYPPLALPGHRLYRSYQTPAALDLFEVLVVTGAWWDLVDEVATRRVGPILRAFPHDVGPVMRQGAADDNLWKRRTAVICQVGSKASTDTELLRECLAPNLDRREFWLRKAVGWALRQYAKNDATGVQSYVSEHAEALSPLSYARRSRTWAQARSGRGQQLLPASSIALRTPP